MTTPATLATNRNNDWFLDDAGNIAVATGIVAIALDCKAAMETRSDSPDPAVTGGECVLDTTLGLPMFGTVWQSWKPAQFIAAARKVLRGVTGVTGVDTFNVTRGGGVMRYTAEIQTTYGPATVTNGV